MRKDCPLSVKCDKCGLAGHNDPNCTITRSWASRAQDNNRQIENETARKSFEELIPDAHFQELSHMEDENQPNQTKNSIANSNDQLKVDTSPVSEAPTGVVNAPKVTSGGTVASDII
jgi:hypothetical protein